MAGTVKRLLLALVFVLVASTPSYAIWTLAQAIPARTNVGASTTTATVNFGSTPTTGNLMVAILLWFDGTSNTAGTPTVKDGNNVAFTVTPNSPSNARPTTAGIVYFFSLQVPASANGAITATFNTTGLVGVATLYAMEFAPSSGTNGGLDVDTTGTGASGTSLNTPTVTVNQANDLLVACGLPDHQVLTVDSPWVQVQAGAGGNFSEGVGYLLSASANTALAMTMNVTSGWDSLGASFKFTPAGGTCVPTMTLLHVGLCG